MRAVHVCALALLALGCAAAPANAASRPDLVEKSVSFAPGAVAAGETVSITDRTANTGSRRSRASVTGFALADGLHAATQLGETRAVGRLAPKRSSSSTTEVTIPASIPAGAYMVVACADDRESVKERRERNNCRTSSAQLTVTG